MVYGLDHTTARVLAVGGYMPLEHYRELFRDWAEDARAPRRRIERKPKFASRRHRASLRRALRVMHQGWTLRYA